MIINKAPTAHTQNKGDNPEVIEIEPNAPTKDNIITPIKINPIISRILLIIFLLLLKSKRYMVL